ncbi:MAG: hypothetical protein AAF532_12400 [Planctomycetota bacterium]
MKYTIHLLTFTYATLFVQSAVQAELINNGSLELFSAGIPDSWTYNNEIFGPTTVESSINSPFGTGVKSARLEDALATNANPRLTQSFSPTSPSGGLSVAFDFFLDDNDISDNTGWFVALVSNFSFKTLAQINRNSELRIPDVANIPISGNKWYRYEAEITVGAFNRFTLDGTLTPFGGQAIAFSGTQGVHAAAYDSLQFGDDTATNSLASPIHFDDVSLSVSAVPEPSSIAIVTFVGVCAGLTRSRAVKRRRK